MKRDPDALYADAMELPESDRAALAERLLRSIQSPADAGIEAAWLAEAEDRLAAYRRGEMQSRPGSEFFSGRPTGDEA